MTKTKSSYKIKKLRKSGSIFVCFHLSWVSEVFSKRNHSSWFRTTNFSDVIHNNIGLSFQNYLFRCSSNNRIVACESRKGYLWGNSVQSWRKRSQLTHSCGAKERQTPGIPVTQVLCSLLHSTCHTTHL